MGVRRDDPGEAHMGSFRHKAKGAVDPRPRGGAPMPGHEGSSPTFYRTPDSHGRNGLLGFATGILFRALSEVRYEGRTVGSEIAGFRRGPCFLTRQPASL